MFKNVTSKLVAALLIGVVLFVSIRMGMFYLEGPAGPAAEQPGSELAVTWNVTWNVGDSWTSAINEGEYNLTVTVIGEEEVLGKRGVHIDCYVMNWTFDPDTPYAITGMRNDMRCWFDKSSFRTMKLKASGKSYESEQWWEWTYKEIHYYTVKGTETDYNQTDEKHTYIDILFQGNWHNYNYSKIVTKTWVKIEAIENVTVAAGEFSCYKMVVYDEAGENVLSITWFSEEVKTIVKSIDYETYETPVASELISYSIP